MINKSRKKKKRKIKKSQQILNHILVFSTFIEKMLFDNFFISHISNNGDQSIEKMLMKGQFDDI